MATSADNTLFHETQISSTITLESALDFYREHGIYYQEDAEIGELAATLGREALGPKGVGNLIPLVLKDQRARNIIDPFLAGKFKTYYVLGRDKGKFFAHTTDPDEDHRIVIYMWCRGTRLEFAHKSHTKTLEGLGAPNRLLQIPYIQLHGLNEFRINLDNGGMVIMHPRLAFTVEDTQGTATGYVLELPKTDPQPL
ncbi:hypothetical protein FOCG_16334 [Fusarium oxysporum f. sp. radicis-lycopersici 26381]|uniref:Uncharacterized protein n=2 Tax=Fusarium oxysporum f. sp. pisi HDV247 TaxID=1080344 RepID=W9NSK6_FUSOX|nr:hypothetical protein FOVG_17879 [Fusarium oxysporum f. sp. pisi HDV247]EXL41532.1 hypothetical protein FOCG_16334 [Fusarium oxysporum f. sp. radicis-lycopersici 26381]